MNDLFFGNFNSAGGGGGSDFWKFLSGALGDIDLKTASGVTGINAVNPQDNRFRLLLNKIGGVPTALFSVVKAALDFSVGIVESGGIVRAFISVTSGSKSGSVAIDETQNIQAVVTASGNLGRVNISQTLVAARASTSTSFGQTELQATSNRSEVNNGTDSATVDILPVQMNFKVRDIALNDASETEAGFNYHQLRITQAAVVKTEEHASVGEIFKLVDTAKGQMYMWLKEDGAGTTDLAQLVLYDSFADNSLSHEIVGDYVQMQFAQGFMTVNNRMQLKTRVNKITVEYNDGLQFSVDKTGIISTNQVSAGAPVAFIPDSTLIVFDLAGNSYKIQAQKI